MTDLVERYVHQVGSYMPQDEQKEIQNELKIIKILWGGAGGRPFISVDTDN